LHVPCGIRFSHDDLPQPRGVFRRRREARNTWQFWPLNSGLTPAFSDYTGIRRGGRSGRACVTCHHPRAGGLGVWVFPGTLARRIARHQVSCCLHQARPVEKARCLVNIPIGRGFRICLYRPESPWHSPRPGYRNCEENWTHSPFALAKSWDTSSHQSLRCVSNRQLTRLMQQQLSRVSDTWMTPGLHIADHGRRLSYLAMVSNIPKAVLTDTALVSTQYRYP
jgi:hypothetical protein